MEEQNPPPDLVPSSPPPASSIPPLRRYFGNGAVADVVLWRARPYAGVSALLGAFLTWIFFEQAGYSFLSLLSNVLLLSVFILFFWAKAANLLNLFSSFLSLSFLIRSAAVHSRLTRHHLC